MPIYEFICRECGERFEELVRSGKEEDVQCCRCSSRDIQRLLSGFAFKSDSGNSGAGSSCGSCTRGSCSSCD
jgi:putative FmdB family regulatory protein